MPQTDDLALLRRFEPILRFNRGERFFPMDVDPYVRESSLWMQRSGSAAQCLVPEGSLTLAELGRRRSDGFDAVYYLKFIEPLNLGELARFQLEERRLAQSDPRDSFKASGRLARVGYLSRAVEALVSLVLLARGRLPGDTAAAAQLTYQRLMQERAHACYHGRVVRQGGWIVLQYWFFYAYNNWRTGFYGINDHEGDWEQICIYAYPDDDGDVHPEWVAYATHDYFGDDLRRRWDDPELVKVGEHPVVYVAGGSHASYYQPGDYLTEIELPFLKPFARLADRIEKARAEAMEEYEQIQLHTGPHRREINFFAIPFVDYARGDGRAIGPGEERPWGDPVLLDPVPNWALLYRGLWGFYMQDPFAGEDAPAGPMYNRDGSVRRSWYDPVGWAGLDKVPAPHRALEKAAEERLRLISRRGELNRSIEERRTELVRLGVQLDAMRGFPHLKPLFSEQDAELDALSAELDALRAERTRDEALLEALEAHIQELQTGNRGPMRAHINRGFKPIPEEEMRLGRLAEIWAAVSIGLVALIFAALVVLDEPLWISLAIMLGLILFIEAAFRRWLGRLLSIVTIVLALVAVAVLLIEFYEPIAIGLVVIVGLYILIENLRELWS